MTHTHENMTPWGQHLVLDLNGCPKELLADKENILKWTKELVEAIDMISYGDPIIEHFATHSHEAAGYTLLQMIETSNIAAHFAENIGQVYIDVFSCKTFDNQIAIDVCKKYFAPQEVQQHTMMRGIFMQNRMGVSQDTGGIQHAKAA